MSLIPESSSESTESTETVETVETSVETPTETPTDEITNSDDAPSFLYAEGVAGDGDIPTWFKDTKYKTVEEQAKAYTELESKFGAFTGAPKDGKYEVEGVDFDDNPLMDTVAKWGADRGLSNEGLGELVTRVGELARQQIEEDQKSAMDALGARGQERINSLAEWGKNNLEPQEYEQFRGLAQTAGHVEVLEKLIGMTKNSKLVDKKAIEDVGAKESKMEEIQKLQFAKDENGRRLMEVDPTHRKKVEALMKQVYVN